MATELIWLVIVANPTNPLYVPDHSQLHILEDVRSPQTLFHKSLGGSFDLLSFAYDIGVPYASESPLLSEAGMLILKDPLTLFLTHNEFGKRASVLIVCEASVLVLVIDIEMCALLGDVIVAETSALVGVSLGDDMYNVRKTKKVQNSGRRLVRELVAASFAYLASWKEVRVEAFDWRKDGFGSLLLAVLS
ncbi:hypothetical protein PIB30_024399 [Stylosanthes scabra]|uniref:Uncharacterized protein n=1 Tax=Stylosanthes scabra TaxID=79078 RepID=A0ABU6TBV5_9FABA|nr:hypothetical protein [Stylosanthes scabra]